MKTLAKPALQAKFSFPACPYDTPEKAREFLPLLLRQMAKSGTVLSRKQWRECCIPLGMQEMIPKYDEILKSLQDSVTSGLKRYRKSVTLQA